jgi:hypothetical protein
MGRAYRIYTTDRKSYETVTEKHEREKVARRRRCKDNAKTDKEMGCRLWIGFIWLRVEDSGGLK